MENGEEQKHTTPHLTRGLLHGHARLSKLVDQPGMPSGPQAAKLAHLTEVVQPIAAVDGDVGGGRGHLAVDAAPHGPMPLAPIARPDTASLQIHLLATPPYSFETCIVQRKHRWKFFKL